MPSKKEIMARRVKRIREKRDRLRGLIPGSSWVVFADPEPMLGKVIGREDFEPVASIMGRSTGGSDHSKAGGYLVMWINGVVSRHLPEDLVEVGEYIESGIKEEQER